jgi:hypothetical protein
VIVTHLDNNWVAIWFLGVAEGAPPLLSTFFQQTAEMGLPSGTERFEDCSTFHFNLY